MDTISSWTNLQFDFLGYVLTPDVLVEKKTPLPQSQDDWAQQTKEEWRKRMPVGSNTVGSPPWEVRQVAIFEIAQSAQQVYYKLAQLEVRLAYYAYRRSLKFGREGESLDCVAFCGLHMPAGTRWMIEDVIGARDFPFKRSRQLCIGGKFNVVAPPPSRLPPLSTFGIQSPPNWDALVTGWQSDIPCHARANEGDALEEGDQGVREDRTRKC